MDEAPLGREVTVHKGGRISHRASRSRGACHKLIRNCRNEVCGAHSGGILQEEDDDHSSSRKGEGKGGGGRAGRGGVRGAAVCTTCWKRRQGGLTFRVHSLTFVLRVSHHSSSGVSARVVTASARRCTAKTSAMALVTNELCQRPPSDYLDPTRDPAALRTSVGAMRMHCVPATRVHPAQQQAVHPSCQQASKRIVVQLGPYMYCCCRNTLRLKGSGKLIFERAHSVAWRAGSPPTM